MPGFVPAQEAGCIGLATTAVEVARVAGVMPKPTIAVTAARSAVIRAPD